MFIQTARRATGSIERLREKEFCCLEPSRAFGPLCPAVITDMPKLTASPQLVHEQDVKAPQGAFLSAPSWLDSPGPCYLSPYAPLFLCQFVVFLRLPSSLCSPGFCLFLLSAVSCGFNFSLSQRVPYVVCWFLWCLVLASACCCKSCVLCLSIKPLNTNVLFFITSSWCSFHHMGSWLKPKTLIVKTALIIKYKVLPE